MSERLACAYCRQRPAREAWRPFCSERCRMADLGRWLREDYRIAGEPAALDESLEAWDEPPAGRRPDDD